MSGYSTISTLIEEQIRTTERHLPKGFSRELPHLLTGSSAHFPWVYDIALEAISHRDGLVDPETLSSFVFAYQSVSILTLGELWEIHIMLRLALALTWIEQQLSESSQTTEQMICVENQQQAADPMSMSNGIKSLRFLGSMDGRDFVETSSVVERTLTEDLFISRRKHPLVVGFAPDGMVRHAGRTFWHEDLRKRLFPGFGRISSACMGFARCAQTGGEHGSWLGA